MYLFRDGFPLCMLMASLFFLSCLNSRQGLECLHPSLNTDVQLVFA